MREGERRMNITPFGRRSSESLNGGSGKKYVKASTKRPMTSTSRVRDSMAIALRCEPSQVFIQIHRVRHRRVEKRRCLGSGAPISEIS
jgi:hypothetical protein